MQLIETNIPDVLVFKPRVFQDNRGEFLESFRQEWFTDRGINTTFVQDNHSRSVRGVIRGLHYQILNPQAKLVMVTRGEVLDIAVDIRRGSPTFGQHVAQRLSAENRMVMFLPEGFAHGFQVLSEEGADFVYKCSRYYDPAGERGILYSDSELALPWDSSAEALLSEKDLLLPELNQLSLTDLPIYENEQ
jgi:dTDP-4-dehydrorhamnose 3,5-epimerase